MEGPNLVVGLEFVKRGVCVRKVGTRFITPRGSRQSRRTLRVRCLDARQAEQPPSPSEPPAPRRRPHRRSPRLTGFGESGDWGPQSGITQSALARSVQYSSRRHGVGIHSGSIHGLRQRSRKSRQDVQDVQDANTLGRRRKSSCESCSSCQNHRSVKLASPLECLGFSVSPFLRFSVSPFLRFSVSPCLRASMVNFCRRRHL